MYCNNADFFKLKKQKKDKILAFSFTNLIYTNFFQDNAQIGTQFGGIDLLRFDIEEFAVLNGYKEGKRVSKDDILPSLSNLNGRECSAKIAVDLPLLTMFDGRDYDIGGILDFVKGSNADFLVIDCTYGELIKKLHFLDIDIIVKADNRSNDEKNKRYFEDLFGKLKEVENYACAFILSDFPDYFINDSKSLLLTPVISNRIGGDGYYGRFSEIFGLTESRNKKYLNLRELLGDSLKDAIYDVTKK